MAVVLTTLPITMLIQQNFLRIVRKRTHLTQNDIGSVLKISDFANVSRWEQGQKTPNVEMLLGYHLLFDIPIESLFDRQKYELRRLIIPRMQERIRYLKTLPSNPKIEGRIGFFEAVLSRLTLNSYGA